MKYRLATRKSNGKSLYTKWFNGEGECVKYASDNWNKLLQKCRYALYPMIFMQMQRKTIDGKYYHKNPAELWHRIVIYREQKETK